MSEQVRTQAIMAQQRQAIWINRLLAERRNRMTKLTKTEARQGDRKLSNLRVLITSSAIAIGGMATTALIM